MKQAMQTTNNISLHFSIRHIRSRLLRFSFVFILASFMDGQVDAQAPDVKSVVERRLALNHYAHQFQQATLKRDQKRYLKLFFEALPSDFATFFKIITYEPEEHARSLQKTSKLGYESGDICICRGPWQQKHMPENPWNAHLYFEKTEPRAIINDMVCGDTIPMSDALIAESAFPLRARYYKPLLRCAYASTSCACLHDATLSSPITNCNLDFVNILALVRQVVSKARFYEKVLSIGVGGVFLSLHDTCCNAAARDLSALQRYIMQLVADDIALSVSVLEAKSNREIAGFFYFLYHYPRISYPYAANKHKKLAYSLPIKVLNEVLPIDKVEMLQQGTSEPVFPQVKDLDAYAGWCWSRVQRTGEHTLAEHLLASYVADVRSHQYLYRALKERSPRIARLCKVGYRQLQQHDAYRVVPSVSKR